MCHAGTHICEVIRKFAGMLILFQLDKRFDTVEFSFFINRFPAEFYVLSHIFVHYDRAF